MMKEKKKRNGKTTPTLGTQTNSLDVKTLKGDTMSNTDSPNSNPITSLEDRRFWDEFIPVFNDYLNDLLNLRNKYRVGKYTDIKELYNSTGSNQATQDFTKSVAGVFEDVVELVATNNNMNYEACASDGYDAVVNDEEVEYKLTMGLGNSWTGNKKSVKVPSHLLVKMDVENNKVSKLFVGLVNLDDCKGTSWYSNGDGKKGNYTSLRFHKNDMNNVTCVYGSLTPKLKWCGVELEEINY